MLYRRNPNKRHFFFFSSRRRHTRCSRDWSSDVCSSDLSQQKPHGIKLVRRPDKGHPHRDEPPRDHDASDPAPCTPTLHDEGAGNFQNDVAEGEDACPESNYAIVEAEIVRHLQGRSGKIVAIKVSNHVEQEHILPACGLSTVQFANPCRRRSTNRMRKSTAGSHGETADS